MGTYARDGGRYKEDRIGFVEEWAVDTEEVTGDHGREEAMELLDALRLYGVLGTEE